MNVDAISSACLLIYDELKDDEKSTEVMEALDGAGDDETVKVSIRWSVGRLIELGKTALAEDIKSKTKGFAF